MQSNLQRTLPAAMVKSYGPDEKEVLPSADTPPNLDFSSRQRTMSYDISPINQLEDERASAPTTEQEHFHSEVYKVRWWILLVFCICSMAQSSMWNTFSPIMDAALIAYDWHDSFVALLPGLANAGYVLCAFPLMYLVETRGMLGQLC